MALQQINWSQINSSNIPSGYSVNIGSESTPIDSTNSKVLLIGEENDSDVLHDFFWYLDHSKLTKLNWTESGHIGTPEKWVGFDINGNAVYKSPEDTDEIIFSLINSYRI
jgi:hypothetical protein